MGSDWAHSVLVIDGQGGGIGRQAVSALKRAYPDLHLVAIGTNSLATAAMLKAGADEGATGENAVVVCAARARVIVGPLGIVVADSLLGEVTPKMAMAVGQSPAERVLIPVARCANHVAGASELPMGRLVECAVAEVGVILGLS